MSVKELNRNQLNELKQNYFYSDDYDEKITTSTGLPVLFAGDIPDQVIFDLFEGVDFVNDDFFCTAGKDEQ